MQTPDYLKQLASMDKKYNSGGINDYITYQNNRAIMKYKRYFNDPLTDP